MITSHISNLSLLESNKQCILHASDDKGYWWASIQEIEVSNVHDAYSYLKLNVILDKGPFKVKNTTPVFSNEETPCIIRGKILAERWAK